MMEGSNRGKVQITTTYKNINEMVSSSLLVIILNIRGLNSPIKRCRVADGLKNIQLQAIYKKLTF